jgi:hypothetical protein
MSYRSPTVVRNMTAERKASVAGHAPDQAKDRFSMSDAHVSRQPRGAHGVFASQLACTIFCLKAAKNGGFRAVHRSATASGQGQRSCTFASLVSRAITAREP